MKYFHKDVARAALTEISMADVAVLTRGLPEDYEDAMRFEVSAEHVSPEAYAVNGSTMTVAGHKFTANSNSTVDHMCLLDTLTRRLLYATTFAPERVVEGQVVSVAPAVIEFGTAL